MDFNSCEIPVNNYSRLGQLLDEFIGDFPRVSFWREAPKTSSPNEFLIFGRPPSPHLIFGHNMILS